MESEFGEAELMSPAVVSPTSLSGATLAHLVDNHLAALWRGEAAADNPFFTWLSSCWRSEPFQEPPTGASSRSVLAAGGLGIDWFDTPGAIVGVIPGHREGHYRVSPYQAAAKDAPERPRARSQPAAH
jgi:hypothetical protein